MAAVERELFMPQEGLALLFAPPFDRTPEDPGYIKGYPPDLRENGGPYTHAALWSVMAMAALGEGDKAAAPPCRGGTVGPQVRYCRAQFQGANPAARIAPDKGQFRMKKIVLTLATVGALASIAVQASAGPVSGAVIGATSGAVVAGPPGAVVGGVAGAVIGGPDIHYYHHHRVYMDGKRHYYWVHHVRHYY